RVVLAGTTTPPVDTPPRRIFAFLDWRPVPALSVVANVDYESERWLQSAINSLVYYQGGSFAVTNFKVAYQASEHFKADIGVNNLTDRNYPIEDGYHAPGRTYFANLRVSL
ncbi:MAG TPA: hypothetical protein VMT50_10230, partial [Steroidobacteraceae bacterium]|nr:hypothetical protein [Steroidobacteraceae bacterium]